MSQSKHWEIDNINNKLYAKWLLHCLQNKIIITEDYEKLKKEIDSVKWLRPQPNQIKPGDGGFIK